VIDVIDLLLQFVIGAEHCVSPLVVDVVLARRFDDSLQSIEDGSQSVLVEQVASSLENSREEFS